MPSIFTNVAVEFCLTLPKLAYLGSVVIAIKAIRIKTDSLLTCVVTNLSGVRRARNQFDKAVMFAYDIIQEFTIAILLWADTKAAQRKYFQLRGVMSDRIKLGEALSAQHTLREAAGLDTQDFSLQEFVGMISDEIEVLRGQAKNDDEIAQLINDGGLIRITGSEIQRFYASKELRSRVDP